METGPDDGQLSALNDDFAELITDGRIEISEPTPAERSSHDHLELARLSMAFDKYRQSAIHRVIRRINEWAP